MGDYAPMRAVLVPGPFSDPGWLFERKLDGIRAGVIRRDGRVRLVSRGGETMNATYPELVEATEEDRFDLIADGEIVAFEHGRTSYRVGDGETAYRHACAHGWEGVVAKRADSPYVPTRSRDWRKIKCTRGQELVIGGWTAGRGARQLLGALLLGYWEGDVLRYDKPAREVVREEPVA